MSASLATPKGPGAARAGALVMAAALAWGAFGAPASAQPADAGVSPYVLRDSTSVLPRWLEGQVQLGLGWMGSPGRERSRYQAGLAAAVGAEAHPAASISLRARLGYQDLPADPFEAVLGGSAPVSLSTAAGHGRLVTALAEASVPLRRALWLFAGGGGAYYGRNGVIATLADDGMTFEPLEPSGWGGAWSAGFRYRFEPNARDHLFLEGRSESVATGTRFRFWGLSAGYRFP